MVVFPLGFPGFYNLYKWSCYGAPYFSPFRKHIQVERPGAFIGRTLQCLEDVAFRKGKSETSMRGVGETQVARAEGRDGRRQRNESVFQKPGSGWAAGGWLFLMLRDYIYYVGNYVGIFWDSCTPCIGRIPMNELI